MIHACTLCVYVYSVAIISNPCLLDKLCFRVFLVLLGFFVVVVLWVFFGVFFSGEGGGLGGSDMIKSSNLKKKIGMVNVPFFFSCTKRGAFIFP